MPAPTSVQPPDTELACWSYGLGHHGEGVCLLLKLGDRHLLLDCGLSDINSLKPTTTAGWPADWVFCSHAHADHAQGLLALQQAYPELPIYASQATTQLLHLNWSTSEIAPSAPLVPKFQARDSGSGPTLASPQRATSTLLATSDSPEASVAAYFKSNSEPDFEPYLRCHGLSWRSPIQLAPNITIEVLPAGHLVGAAVVLITYQPTQTDSTEIARPYTIAYTGDCLLANTRLTDSLPLDELRNLKPDVLIVEGTYGTRRHPRRRQQEAELATELRQALNQGRSALLPVPTLGLGQELLMLLRSHHQFTGQDFDIWVDERVALGCDAYAALLPELPRSVQNFARYQPLFWDQRILPRVQRLPVKQLPLASERPQIILCHTNSDWSFYCDRPGYWTLFLPQTGSLPGQLDWHTLLSYRQAPDAVAKLERWQEHDRVFIQPYLLADHCDGDGTTQLIHNLRPQHLILIHGAPGDLADLAALDSLSSRYHLHLPSLNHWVKLPIGAQFMQPAAPQQRWCGELLETADTVTANLPQAITTDERWQHLAETGIVEARWQGNELVIRGLSPKELVRLDRATQNSVTTETCAICCHYRGQRCWQKTSPLYSLKVAASGYCPAFEPTV
ncbi:MAG: MBL fold metallo-hydrolase [Cyanobacteria bacterium P01_H01_bin.121]